MNNVMAFLRTIRWVRKFIDSWQKDLIRKHEQEIGGLEAKHKQEIRQLETRYSNKLGDYNQLVNECTKLAQVSDRNEEHLQEHIRDKDKYISVLEHKVECLKEYPKRLVDRVRSGTLTFDKIEDQVDSDIEFNQQQDREQGRLRIEENAKREMHLEPKVKLGRKKNEEESND